MAVRQKLFARGVLKHCHRLPRELGGAPALATFKVTLLGALGNLMGLQMSLPVAGGLD